MYFLQREDSEVFYTERRPSALFHRDQTQGSSLQRDGLEAFYIQREDLEVFYTEREDLEVFLTDREGLEFFLTEIRPGGLLYRKKDLVVPKVHIYREKTQMSYKQREDLKIFSTEEDPEFFFKKGGTNGLLYRRPRGLLQREKA